MKSIIKATLEEQVRFWKKVNIEDSGCWLWLGGVNENGYGKLRCRNVDYQAHRFIYTQIKGDIPEGLTLDHLCKNKLCVNPDHLDAVPIGVNTARGTTWEHFANKTHCPSGHEYTKENTRFTTQRNGRHKMRQCKECNRLSALKSYYNRRMREVS